MTEPNEVFERSFSVDMTATEPAELVLNNINGTVEIQGWDYPEIRVSGVKRPAGLMPWVSPEEGFRATRIEIEPRGNGVLVRTTHDHTSFWGMVQWISGVAKVDYAVRVPRRCNVVVDLVAGRLSVADIRGNVITRVVSAGTVLRHIDGTITCNTVAGGIDGEDLRGKAALQTVSGGIKIRRADFVSLNGQTVSGGIEVETPLDPAGTYEFQGVSAGFRLYVPAGTACTGMMQSITGAVKSELPAKMTELKRGHWRAEVNGGGTRVQARSVSGTLYILPQGSGAGSARKINIEDTSDRPTGAGAGATPGSAASAAYAAAQAAVRKTDPGTGPTPVAPTPPPAARPEATAPVDRESVMMMILAAVEKGDLTVEEAAVKLAELDRLTDHAPEAQSEDAPGTAGAKTE